MKSYILFGTGSAAEKFINKFEDINILFFVDNNPEKWGTSFLEKKIISPKELENYKDHFIIITSSYYFEIRDQLIQLGFKEFENFITYLCYNPKSEEILKSFKDIHKGKRAFVLGNGPSLKVEDLDLLKDEITFASNKIYLAYTQTEWRPTYYFVADVLVSEYNAEKICSLPGTKFFVNYIAQFYEGFEMNGNATWLQEVKMFLNTEKLDEYAFSKNVEYYIQIGRTVTYVMLQLAFYMGITEVYILGVDFSYAFDEKDASKDNPMFLTSKGEVNHFHPDYRPEGEKWVKPSIEEQYYYFTVAKKVYEEDGRKIINCSRQTKLDVFERMPLEKVFEE